MNLTAAAAPATQAQPVEATIRRAYDYYQRALTTLDFATNKSDDTIVDMSVSAGSSLANAVDVLKQSASATGDAFAASIAQAESGAAALSDVVDQYYEYAQTMDDGRGLGEERPWVSRDFFPKDVPNPVPGLLDAARERIKAAQAALPGSPPAVWQLPEDRKG